METSPPGYTANCALLQGSTVLAGAANFWHAYALMAYKFHAWLALRRYCWRSDRFARHGLTSFSLCGKDNETLAHISLHYPFALRLWAGVMTVADVHLPMPKSGLVDAWRPQVVLALPASQRKDGNSLIMSVIRALWLERNAAFFDAKDTSSQVVLSSIVDTWKSWVMCKSRKA
jgi:hypothetical protein